jgi:hypothetical protein
VELLESGAAVKQTLKKLKQGIKKVLPNRKMNQVLLLDSVTLHTIVRTREAVATVWCTYRPYSPYLTPFYFHIFGPLKDALLTPFCIQAETQCFEATA